MGRKAQESVSIRRFPRSGLAAALLALAVFAIPLTGGRALAQATGQVRAKTAPQAQPQAPAVQARAGGPEKSGPREGQPQPPVQPREDAAKLPPLALLPHGYGGGGRFTCAAVDPSDPARVYVGSDVSGYFVSTDHGQSFTVKGAGLGGLAMAAIAVNPDDPRQVLFLADDGLYESLDRGETLVKVSAKVHYGARFFGSTLLLHRKDGWYAATDSEGVFKVAPGAGGAWVVTPLFGLQGVKVNSLAVCKDRLVAATDEGMFVHDGEIWKTFDEGLPSGKRNMVDMAMHPSGRLYAVEKQTGVFVLNPGSNVWEKRGPNPLTLPSQNGNQTFKSLAVSPDDPNLLMLATDPNSWPHLVLRSQDGGKSWELVKRFALSGVHDNWAKDVQSVEQIVFSPEKHGLFLLDWWNVWRSVDDGASWLQILRGLQNTVVNDVQASLANPSVIYVATDDNGLMVSRDNGQVWRRKMNGLPDGHATAVSLSAGNPNLVYVLLDPWKGLDTGSDRFFQFAKSLDGGETWKIYRFRDRKKTFDKPFATGRPTNLVIDPASDDVVYVTSNGYGIYRIDTAQEPQGPDSIVKAEHVSATLPSPYVKGHGALQIDPANPKTIVVGTQDGGIFRTEDGGANWRLVGAPKGFIFGMARDPKEPNRLYAAAGEKRLYISTDNGASWQASALPGPKAPNVAANAVCVVPSVPGMVVVGTLAYNHKAGEGLYASGDHGATFTHVDADLPGVGVNVLVPYGKDGGLALVGYNGMGLYELARKAGPAGQ